MRGAMVLRPKLVLDFSRTDDDKKNPDSGGFLLLTGGSDRGGLLVPRGSNLATLHSIEKSNRAEYHCPKDTIFPT